MLNIKLTNKDYCNAAKDLRCEVAALMAVAEVESAGGGFDELGRLKVRFEGHKFREYTFGKFDKSHPHLSYPYKYQGSKAHGYYAFSQAYAIDEEAALKASSWGKFQPLAVNYREAGFTSVRAFVDFLRVSESNQLKVFVAMVKFRQIDDELQRLDFAGFARNYNGRSYRDNDYDGKMLRAYKRYKTLKINCNEVLLSEREIDNLLIRFDEKQPAVQIGSPIEQPAQTPAQIPTNPISESQSLNAENLPTSPVASNNTMLDKVIENAPNIQNITNKFDQIVSVGEALNSRKDAAKSIWATIGQIFYQTFWAIFAFIYGIPLIVWIVVAVIAAIIGGLYLYRQISLGKIREFARLQVLGIADFLK